MREMPGFKVEGQHVVVFVFTGSGVGFLWVCMVVVCCCGPPSLLGLGVV